MNTTKRNSLMIMPLLGLPFIILCFWALGGGKKKQEPSSPHSNGLNTQLPAAQLDNKPMDKLSMYQQAEKDSLARRDADRFDPFARWMDDDSSRPAMSQRGNNVRSGAVETPFSSKPSFDNSAPVIKGNQQLVDPNEAKVNARLAELEKVLASGQTDPAMHASADKKVYENVQSEINQLDNIAQTISGGNEQQDPELAQMNQMLSKILDIQHPSLVRDRLKAVSEKEKGKVFAVRTNPGSEMADDLLAPKSVVNTDSVLSRNGDSLVALPVATATNRFYDSEVEEETPAVSNAITAVVHETQVLVTGATLKLRLTQDVYIEGQLIPTGTFVYGESSLSGERMQCTITHIHYNDALFPVSLTVYDEKDGLLGLHVPGAISRDVAKQGTDEAIQSLQLATLDPNIGAQAAAAGIETVKKFLSKKTKLITVTAKAGHPVLLLDRQ